MASSLWNETDFILNRTYHYTTYSFDLEFSSPVFNAFALPSFRSYIYLSLPSAHRQLCSIPQTRQHEVGIVAKLMNS
jgi:hypothetical protein